MVVLGSANAPELEETGGLNHSFWLLSHLMSNFGSSSKASSAMLVDLV